MTLFFFVALAIPIVICSSHDDNQNRIRFLGWESPQATRRPRISVFVFAQMPMMEETYLLN